MTGAAVSYQQKSDSSAERSWKNEGIATGEPLVAETRAAISHQANDRVLLSALHSGHSFQILDRGEDVGFCLRIFDRGVHRYSDPYFSIWETKQYALNGFGVPKINWRLGDHIA